MADTQMRAGSNAVDAKNVVVSQIHAALRLLRKKKVLSDESVHSARKKLKRARAGLRLLPDAVGKSAYARENAQLRDAARPFGRVRDAKASNGNLRAPQGPLSCKADQARRIHRGYAIGISRFQITSPASAAEKQAATDSPVQERPPIARNALMPSRACSASCLLDGRIR